MNKFKPPKLGSKKREIYDIIAKKYNHEFSNNEIAKKIIFEYEKLTQLSSSIFEEQIKDLYLGKQRLLFWINEFKSRKKAYGDFQEANNEKKKKARLKRRYQEARKLVKKYSKSLTDAKYQFYRKNYLKIDIISSDHKLKKYVQNEKKITELILKKIVDGAFKNALGFTEEPINYVKGIINNTIIDETEDVPEIIKYLVKIQIPELTNYPEKYKGANELKVNESWDGSEKLDKPEKKLSIKGASGLETKILKQAKTAYSLYLDHRDKESKNSEDEIISKIDCPDTLDLLCEAIENAPDEYKNYIKKQYLEKAEGGKIFKKDTAKQLGIYPSQIAGIERNAFAWIRSYMKERGKG